MLECLGGRFRKSPYSIPLFNPLAGRALLFVRHSLPPLPSATDSPYGFHGILPRSHGLSVSTIRHLPREQTNIVSLHLGNGWLSAAAITRRKSLDHLSG